jgi:hypothetical protein
LSVINCCCRRLLLLLLLRVLRLALRLLHLLMLLKAVLLMGQWETNAQRWGPAAQDMNSTREFWLELQQSLRLRARA